MARPKALIARAGVADLKSDKGPKAKKRKK